MLKDISAKSAQKRKNRKRNRDGRLKNSSTSKGSRSTLSRGGLWGLSSTAASYEVSLSNPTAFEFVKGGGLAHREWGSATRVRGRQQLITLATTASNSNLFVTGLGTASTNNTVNVSPSQLGDRVAYIGAMFQRYAFRKLRFIYVTRVGTTQVGSFAMAYTTDGGANISPASFSQSYASIQSIDPCRIVPFRKEFDCLDVSYTGERTWYVDPGNITSEGARQIYQGVLWGYPDVTSIGVVNQGEIYIEYELDFYVAAAADSAITLSVLGDESVHLKSFLRLLQTVPEKDRLVVIERFSSFIKFTIEKIGQINKSPL